ncbi:MAG: calcium-transporting P-type ATPase, PMR1-type [Atribacterota bacterium]|nr:calcium-transporting P-type ATPase, PMR1-type [Atribacterota bacterium]MDD5637300.1 calcium-transporting P-type ATPase, PMR1-type [Atribacterota bacterium]
MKISDEKENQTNKYYLKTALEAEKELNTSLKVGLSSSEVKQRLEKIGPNQLKEGKKRTVWHMLIDQFKDVLIIILLASAVISVLLGEVTDAIVIGIIVILNAILSVLQEYRAEKSLDALKKMTVPETLVMRDGKQKKIKSTQLVPGDLVLLESGDRIPADLRLVEVTDLSIQEAILTGESEPAEKTNREIVSKEEIPLGDRLNIAYMGTTVIAGRGRGIVVATGMDTEMGQIASMLQEQKKELTPLQKKLNQVGKNLGIIILFVIAIVVLLGCLRGIPFFDMFLTGISLAVAAVPEGLPAVVTIVLALGVQQMIKKNAIIRRLPAVETLGATTVICSDKTGTLTQNQMTVQKLVLVDREIEVEGVGYQPFGQFRQNNQYIQPSDDQAISLLLKAATLCNNSYLKQNEENNQWEIIGDPTEGALVVVAAKAGYQKEGLENKYPRLRELPFDSERKRMSTVHRTPEGDEILFVKGAPDQIIERCSSFRSNSKEKAWSQSLKGKIAEQNKKLASEALRVLAVAYREINSQEKEYIKENKKLNIEKTESELTFLGLVAMIDPPRKEAKEAVKTCRKAGIRPIMITGDYSLTAQAIADQIGIYQLGDRIITGSELEKMPQEELEKVVMKTTIFARVSPRHKMRIVHALQKNNQVVAMTGDGVNDAPALKESDIGVAMGITGTDVSKEAADMILTDDNFSSIVSAVQEGRKIYQNIQKFIRYLLSCNLGEILTIFVAILIGLPRPLLPIQILWVNLVTDGLPALALGLDPAEKDVMIQPPRNPKEGIFSGKMGFNIFSQGIFIGIITLIAFYYGYSQYSLVVGETMAFGTLSFTQLWQSLNSRSDKFSIFRLGIFSNRYLVLAILGSGILQLMVMLVPFLQSVFQVTALTFSQWLVVILISLTAIPYVELLKKLKLTYFFK